MANEDRAKLTAKPQRITLDERARLTVTGVEEVMSFDEERIVMRTVLGELTVLGSGLHIGRLSLDTGELGVEGEVSELAFSERGAAGGLCVTMTTLLNPGDEVICISPYFFEYNNYITTPGGVVVVVPASEAEGFVPDVEAIAKAVTPKTKAIILNNPNNPTGVVYPAELLKKLSDMLVEKGREYGTTIYVVSDEPYRELAYDGVEVPWMPNCMENVIVGYSWSKSLSLPGERIGYVLVGQKVAQRDQVYAAICGAGPNNPRGRGWHEVSGEGSNWTYFLRKSYPSSKSEISILPQGEDICFFGDCFASGSQ